ncbi:ATPase H(+)-transporting accessory protein 2 [Arctopsyche grandis]|uniref:ATPase H(+)-transporting accessory protein 2 n=1 Tax=Arctopsyche grandis TaxID=121162 RepID=UPI00406D85A0
MASFRSKWSQLLHLLVALSLANDVIGTGELFVLHSPKSLKFTGHELLHESLVKEVYSAALGFSIEHGPGWSGLMINDPFGSPEAVVEIFVDGISSIGSKGHLKGHKYPLITDYNEFNTWESLHRRITQRFPESGNKLVNINLSEGLGAVNEYKNIFGEVKAKVGKLSLNALKPKVNEEDYQFLQDLELLKAITEKVASGAIVPDNKVDFFYITVPSLHPLSDLHGAESAATKEAKILLSDAVSQLSQAFSDAYDGNVLVTLVVSDSSHTRRTRSLLQTTGGTAGDIDKLNIAKVYSAQFPVIFNIIFWFSIVLILTLIAVTYTIADMDPGRDSIIYRMTSNRMKKEN